jgi:glycosyltransferase involved in cell wall biosynthesis
VLRIDNEFAQCVTSLAIVIPTYNSDLALFAACLASVACQSERATRIVVVDDGSRSDVVKRLSHIARASRIRDLQFVALPRHTGMAGARNEGIKRAACEWTILLDSDDRLVETACARVRAATHEEAHIVYSDHEMITADGAALVTRRKAAYHAALEIYGGTWMSPLLHATFVFHLQAYRTATLLQLGCLASHWGYGDEIEMQLEIEARFGSAAFRHVPEVLYRYVKNPVSVVHQPSLYAQLITNIETILLTEMRRRCACQVQSCSRVGRARDHHAAHYVFAGDGSLAPPWFDNTRLQFDPRYGRRGAK